MSQTKTLRIFLSQAGGGKSPEKLLSIKPITARKTFSTGSRVDTFCFWEAQSFNKGTAFSKISRFGLHNLPNKKSAPKV